MRMETVQNANSDPQTLLLLSFDVRDMPDFECLFDTYTSQG